MHISMYSYVCRMYYWPDMSGKQFKSANMQKFRNVLSCSLLWYNIYYNQYIYVHIYLHSYTDRFKFEKEDTCLVAM